jgi:hypothetical protein
MCPVRVVAAVGYGFYFGAIVLPVGFLVVMWPIVIYRIYSGEQCLPR